MTAEIAFDPPPVEAPRNTTTAERALRRIAHPGANGRIRRIIRRLTRRGGLVRTRNYSRAALTELMSMGLWSKPAAPGTSAERGNRLMLIFRTQKHWDASLQAAALAETTAMLREGMISEKISDWPVSAQLLLYPRAASHLVSESLGYCTIEHAARMLCKAKDGEADYCEWIDSCVRKKEGQTWRQGMAEATRTVVKHAMMNPTWSPRKRRHSGFMADNPRALVHAVWALAGKQGRMFAAWF